MLPRTRATALLAAGALAAAALVQAPAALAATATYTMTDLGTLGYTSVQGTGLNASGQATGIGALPNTVPATGCPPKRKMCVQHPAHAFASADGTITDLGTLGGIFSAGESINTTGTIAGYADLSTGAQHAAVFQGGTITDLGSLFGPSGSSEATAINDSGQVAGWTTAANGTGEHAFLDSNGVMTDLGILPGGTFSTAAGINDAGVVVGSMDNAASDSRAFAYQDGTLTDLGTLGGPGAAAYAINASGQIVGWAQTSTDATHAFEDTGGKMTDLGAYNIDTVAYAINDHGVIVGQTYGTDSSGNTFDHAFIYQNGRFQDLNTLIPAGSGWELTDATAINDNGQILVDADNTTNGDSHAFLLTPTS